MENIIELSNINKPFIQAKFKKAEYQKQKEPIQWLKKFIKPISAK